MHEALVAILVLLAAALALGAMAERFRQTSVLGYLRAGTVDGPGVLGWVDAGDGIEALAELGAASASLDLGAGPVHTFFKVTLPLIVPGIVAAAMLSFALSLDDFIITYFVSGSTVTYPLYVNAATKAAVPPQINVLATAILLISLVLLIAGTLYRRKRVVV